MNIRNAYHHVEEQRLVYAAMIGRRANANELKLHAPQEQKAREIADLPLFRDLLKAA